MGLKDLFRKKEKDLELDPLADLVLHKLKVGYLVDYDLKTWRVTGYSRYRFDGDTVEEWDLTAGRETRYLELANGEWFLAKKIPIGAIDGDVRRHILDHEDPPDRIVYKGKEYYLDESYAGQCYPNGEGRGQDLIKWEFLDDEEASFVAIEQWSETEFGAATGFPVADYQFTSILPAASP